MKPIGPSTRPYATTTVLRVLLPGRFPSAEEVRERLSALGEIEVEVEVSDDGAWRARCDRRDAAWILTPERALEIEIEDFDGPELSEEERVAIERARYAISLEGALAPRECVPRFTRLLEVAAGIAPDAVGLVDGDSGALYPGAWLSQITSLGVPLRLDIMYRIHAVTGEEGTWLHTHGLARCGMRELELLDVPVEQVHGAGALLRAAAHRSLVHGLPDRGETITYGHDLACALVPWVFTHHNLDPELGGPEDRGGEHSEDALVLVTWQPTGPTQGVWISAADQLGQGGTHPVLFLTDYETERMEALARLKWQGFALLADHFSGAEGWRFLAKFGYGGDPTGSRREHLWFEVHAADPRGAEGTLVNEPYQDLGLHEGDRGRHHLERLTDFRVSSPVGGATPEDLDRFMRRWMASTRDEEAH